jgi:hypothetical protein
MNKYEIIDPDMDGVLFDRVVSILEQARGHVVRAVNSNMVLAYWWIGREIVQEIQGGEERAEYGRQVVADLSSQLTQKYKSGFLVTSLQDSIKFYQAYAQRFGTQHPPGAKFGGEGKGRPLGNELESQGKLSPAGREITSAEKHHPSGGEFETGFNPQLTWSHYRALMRVKDEKARGFYERETAECGWSFEGGVLKSRVSVSLAFGRRRKQAGRMFYVNLL